MPKRQCLPAKPISCDCFDLQIRPLYPHSQTEMPVCVEIKPTVLSQTKDYTTTVIILADVSGSMLDGAKMSNMREGIVRLGELSERFASVKTDFLLIEFNDTAKVTHAAPKMPSTIELRRICERLSPCGGTNIGAALDLALSMALSKKAVHIALFTDGEDTCNLKDRLLNTDDIHVHTLRHFPMLWLHCVGICTDFDSRLLDSLSRTARRGTFQSVKEENISKLMGTMWGLMIEAVDPNCTVTIEIDGAVAVKREVVLRVCDPPMECRVLVPSVPAGIKEIKATLRVGDECMIKTDALPRDEGSAMDEVCASETISEIQATAFDEVAAALATRDFEKATDANARAVTAIERLFDFDVTPEAVKQVIVATLKELEDQAQDIARSQNDFDVAKDTELRALSRSSTTRNSGASLDPTGRSLSELQSQLIDA